jgi:predicted metal-dependent phosphoesterase TrpH
MTVAPTADLHLHTTFSDGTETPERVLEMVQQAGLSAVAITDHDTVEGMARSAAAAAARRIELIPGIEMSSCSRQGIEVHLLGFLFDREHPLLTRHLAEQKARRVERVHEMVKRLQRVGVTIQAEEVLQLAGEGTVGRPHVARVLLKHGYVSSFSEAFSRYIGTNNPGFVPGSTLSPAHVLGVIRAAGGIPVLAHPIYLKCDPLIDELAQEGLLGLEVYHACHPPETVRHYEQIADRLKLLKTGGSDFHGDAKEGQPVGSVKIPYTLVDALKQWKTTSVH